MVGIGVGVSPVYQNTFSHAPSLAAPANLALSITGASKDVITATWDAVSGATDYEIEYSDDGVTYAPVDTTALLTYGVTSADYDAGAALQYIRVRAVGGVAWATANIDGWKLNTRFYANLNEASGNRATQVSGLTLTDNNTVGSTAGIISNGANFVAANTEYLSVADNSCFHFSDADFVLSAWIHPETASADYAHILAKDEPGAREWVWYVARSGGTFQHEFYLFDSGNSIVGSLNVPAQAYDATYRILILRDGTDLKMYIGNTLVSTNALTGTPRAGTAAGVRFGIDTGTNPGTAYDGWIDEIAICKGRAWSAAQITHNWNSGAGRTY